MPIIINGLGLSGLSFYDSLLKKDKVLAIEKNIELGGFTRTTRIDSFQFDYTGHFLHLKNFSNPSLIGQKGKTFKDNWKLVSNNSGVLINGKICAAPYQYNFGQLGREHALEAIESYQKRPLQKSFKSLKEFFKSTFGEYMSNKFFIPYNEKLLGIELSKLSEFQVGRFFPEIKDNLIKSQIYKINDDTKTYNSKYWYPKLGGIDLLIKHFDKPREIIYSSISRINVLNNSCVLEDGSSHIFSKFVSSISLKQLLSKIENLPKEFNNYNENLTASKQFAVNLGINKIIPILDKYAWLYIPDPATNIYRIGNYSYASKYMSGSGSGMSLYIEISSNSKNPVEDAKKFLKDNFAVEDKDISCLSLNSLYPGYVHFKKGQEKYVENILKWLRINNIYSIGRYGSWDYVSMEDCIVSASSLAKSFR